MLHFADYFCFFFHTLWMLFNCLGWAWKRTRLWNLLTLALTAASWFILGMWFGWGYCLCTDWHWQVRGKLGYPREHTYVHLLVLEMTGMDFPPELVDRVTVSAFFVAAGLSLALNTRDLVRWWRRQEPAPTSGGT
jgi:hypothetical protein